ncbi:2OG-Fe(II) oxygenase [Ectothiorhodospiraceae bacterium BW-2]|nr:2OG-Fe(II) oxygenase [Ectothiorhodospiraceae bacterium BW-2]
MGIDSLWPYEPPLPALTLDSTHLNSHYDAASVTATELAEKLRCHGYAVCDDLLPLPLREAMALEIRAIGREPFQRGGIGRRQQLNEAIRRDQILWLTDQLPAAREYLRWLEGLRQQLNRELLLGVFDFEGHYAYYPPSAFYAKHFDAFQNSDRHRILTVITYLNRNWQPEEGGELILYDQNDKPLLTVLPESGRQVLFLSEEFAHEVRPAQRYRYSATGWFRVNQN